MAQHEFKLDFEGQILRPSARRLEGAKMKNDARALAEVAQRMLSVGDKVQETSSFLDNLQSDFNPAVGQTVIPQLTYYAAKDLGQSLDLNRPVEGEQYRQDPLMQPPGNFALECTENSTQVYLYDQEIEPTNKPSHLVFEQTTVGDVTTTKQLHPSSGELLELIRDEKAGIATLQIRKAVDLG